MLRTVLPLVGLLSFASPAAAALDYTAASRISCRDLLAAERDHNATRLDEIVEPVIDHVSEHALFPGSSCNIRDYLTAECWRDPRLTIRQAVQSLRDKSLRRTMPCIPVCGAYTGPLRWSC